MRRYSRKVLRALREVLAELPTKGWRRTGRELQQMVYSEFESVMLSRNSRGEVAVTPGVPIEIRAYQPTQRDAVLPQLRAAFPQSEKYFARGGCCYLATHEGAPVGIGWSFAESPLLRSLRYPPDAVYLGDFWVDPMFRGKHIAGAIIAEMLKDLADSSVQVVAEIEAVPLNQASKRAFERVGFQVDGRVKLYQLAGVILHHTWQEYP